MVDKTIHKSKDIEKSIVQIFSDHNQPSYAQPWLYIKREKSSGTGFCINLSDFVEEKLKSAANKDKYIITNAHCVHNSSYITIRKRGVATPYVGRIDGIIYECDLAILSIDTAFYQKSKQRKDISKIMNEFWNDLLPLEIGHLPSKLDTVYVYGYPLGGYNISITTGSVNRIQNIQYFDATTGIAIQIDAPINFGNSGGPVVNVDGDVVGIAFAGEPDHYTQNMGYIIPTISLRYFLNTIRRGKKFNGVSSLGIQYQELNNIVLREYLGLRREETGILVLSTDKFGSSDGIIRKMDIIKFINDKKVDNDGTLSLYDILDDNKDLVDPIDLKSELLQMGEVSLFTTSISLKNEGSQIKVTVLRDGKVITLDIILKPRQFLVPLLEYQIRPSYYIISGLVFVPLSQMFFIEKKQNREYVSHLMDYLDNQELSKEGEQIIVLSQIFITELTEGYPDDNFVLKSINDIEIINLAHLYTTVQDLIRESEYLKFEFKDTRKIIILSKKDINKSQEDIIFQNIGDVSDYMPS